MATDAERWTEHLGRMTAALRHRGPDDAHTKNLPGCLLGHRRLSVIDLVTGQQPMPDETGRYWITFNGEIYNYRELRQWLERDGVEFRTQSDTEVLVQAYRRLGCETPSRLNGQFAFFIWDQREQEGFAARDRLGEKPLYWAHSSRGPFLVASEVKALLASGLVEGRIDPRAVDAYLALLYVPPHRTIYENVHSLRPGHMLLVKHGGVVEREYWRARYGRKKIQKEEAVSQIRALVRRAVDRQKIADVPLARS